jgi:ParB/RepB/Spo0J family partition protein
VLTVPRSAIHVEAGHNPRQDVAGTDIEGLAASITENGLLTPLTVKATDGGYKLIAGERRLTALDSLCIEGADYDVPVIVTEADDRIAALVENIQREDLNPVDEAYGYLDLVRQGLTPKGIAQRVGVSQARVTKRLEVLELPVEVIERVRKGKIPVSAIKSLTKMAYASPDLAKRASARAAGKEHWTGILAKEPQRIAHLLADDPKEPYWAVPGSYNADAIAELKGEVLKPKDPEDPAEGDEKLTGKDVAARLSKFDSDWHKAKVRIDGQDAVDYARGLQSTYEAGEKANNYGEEQKCFIVTDPEVLLYLAEREVTELELAQARNARAALESKTRSRKVPTTEDGLSTEEVEKAKKERKKARDAELEQRKVSRGANLGLGRAMLMEFAGGCRTDEVVELLVRELLHAWDCGRVGQGGFRYVHEPAQTVEPQGTTKDGKRKDDKITYLTTLGENARTVEEFVLGGRSADEKLGRLLTVIGAAEGADQRCVSEGSRRRSGLAGSNEAIVLRRRLVEPLMDEEPRKQLRKAGTWALGEAGYGVKRAGARKLNALVDKSEVTAEAEAEASAAGGDEAPPEVEGVELDETEVTAEAEAKDRAEEAETTE